MAAAAGEGGESGYEVLFVDPLDKDYECPICLLALRDPVQTSCGHSFCKTCFNRVARQQGGGDRVECPIDKQRIPVSEVFNDLKVKRKVLSLKVKCGNKSEGLRKSVCSWVGALSDYQHHLTKCDYETVKCDNDCGMDLQRCALRYHKSCVCDRRIVICEFCKNGLEQRELQAHLAICLKMPVLCPLGCGLKVKREDVNGHVTENGDCPNTLVNCPFRDARCEVTCKRHELRDHLTSNVVEHQIKQQQMMKRLSDENTELKRRLETVDRAVSSQLRQLFMSPSQSTLSSCGRAMFRFKFDLKTVRNIESSSFLMHSVGYKAKVVVYLNGYPNRERRDYISIAIVPVESDGFHQLRWPCTIGHTISVVNQVNDEKNISKTINPATMDDDLLKFCFSKPNNNTTYSFLTYHRLSQLRLREAMLNVEHSGHGSKVYIRDGFVVVTVTVDGN